MDDITNLVGLHHSLGFYDMLPFDHMEEHVVHQDTDHSLGHFSTLTSLFKQEDLTNDTPS